MEPGPARPRLRWNLLLLYGGEGTVKILGVVAFGLLGHHLGPASYGDLEFAIAVFFVLNLVMEAGLGPYGAREGAKRPDDIGRLAGLIASLRTLILFVSAGLLALLAAGLADDPGKRELVLLYGLALVPGAFLMNWVYQARDRMHVVAISNVVRNLTLFFGVVLLVKEPDDAYIVPLSDAVGLGLVVLGQQVLFRGEGYRFRLFEDLKAIARVARECSALALSTLAWALRVFFPTLALGFFATGEETGIYGSAHRLVVAMHTFAWLYFFNILPSISRASLEEGNESWRRLVRTSFGAVAWVVLPGCLAMSALGPLLMTTIYGEAFAAGAAVFAIQVWMPAAAFLSGHQRYSLIGFGHVGAEFRASVAGAAVSILGALGLALAGALDPVSAAWVFLAAEVTTLVLAQILLGRRVERLPIFQLLARPLVALAAGLAAWRLLLPDGTVGAAALVLGVALAAAAVLEPSLFRRFLRRPGPGRGAG